MAKLKVVAEIEPKGNFPVVSAPNVAVGNSTLDSVISGIDTNIGNKVDKVSGKGLSTNDYTTTEKNKLAGIANNANNYVHPTTSGNKHIPSGGSSGKILGWDSDGTAKWIDDKNTEYSDATTTTHGLMSTTDKSKLDGIANNANNYVHPTTSGNKHIPSGGSSGKILGWSSDGTAAWIDEPSKGTVTSVKVGSTSYSPSSGVVSLPEYVTYGTKGVFTKVMSSLVIRNGSYMIKNNIFYVANIFFTTISDVPANTETTLATASSLPTYEVKAVATVYKNDNSSILTDSAILKIKEDGTVTITSPVAIGSNTNSGRINNLRIVDLSA